MDIRRGKGSLLRRGELGEDGRPREAAHVRIGVRNRPYTHSITRCVSNLSYNHTIALYKMRGQRAGVFLAWVLFALEIEAAPATT